MVGRAPVAVAVVATFVVIERCWVRELGDEEAQPLVD